MTNSSIPARDTVQLTSMGRVRTYLCDAAGKPIKIMSDRPNLITYQGADILAKLLGGTAGFTPNYMWVELETPSFNAVTPARTDTAASLLAGYSVAQDVVTAPFAGSAGYLSSAAAYSHNRVSFWGVTDVAEGVIRAITLAGAQVRGAVLTVHDYATDNIANDLVFSHVSFSSFTVPSGQRVGVEWIITVS